ncbi:rod shape-determining protein MreC [Sphingomonas sp.]|jgi:rod shape-determining protein MreC|uniref:rod shape-determining protein MreC n=1 Tax=Sphingomonas sp. TaxID=28214 RepID=UPI002E34E8FC|nr:rod shape-determining protein MreC [Sphingomonas sp.]HEX4693651.1 rod shape-determining protein MreC [Sphingomonas sp.]
MAPPRNRRPGFSRRAQYGLFIGYVIAIAGALVGAVLLALATFDPPAFSALRSGAAEVTAPISWGVGSIWRGITGIPSAIGSFFGVHGENARLKEQIAGERQQLIRARAIAYENIRLKKLLAVREPGTETVTTARVVSSSAGSTRRFALLYAGLIQGVHAGMPVRAADGLVGRVLEAGPDTARILLLTDPESVIPVRRTRDGAPGFATGRGDGVLDVKPIALGNAAFGPGDVLVTSGTGGLFPPNLPVGQVTSRTRDGALARPYASPDALDYAIVLSAFMTPPPAPPADSRP